MKSIKERVRQFNKAVKDKSYRLAFEPLVNHKELSEIQKAFQIATPLDLQWFYKEVGGIKGDAEDFTLNIYPPAYLIHKLDQQSKWEKCRSLGIIDMIKFSWSNDRPEFDRIDKQKTDYLNAGYKCFGFYRYDWGLDEAYYLYFDKNGNFGEVRYHQDEFDELWDEHLTPMLTRSLANEQLEKMIIRIINKLEEGIKNSDE